MRKFFTCLIFSALFFSVLSLGPNNAFAGYTATVNLIGTTSAGSPWINVTIAGTGGWTANYMVPTAQTNTFLAVAMTAISSGKSVAIEITGAEWSTLASIALVNS